MSRPACPVCGEKRTHRHQSRGSVVRYKCTNPPCQKTFSATEGDPIATITEPSVTTPSFEEVGNHAMASLPREGKPPTLDMLFKKFEIKPEDWKVLSYKINEWQQHSGEFGIVPLYQGKATLIRKKPVVCEWPTVQPVRMAPKPAKRAKESSTDLDRAIVIADSQIGFFRDFDTFKVNTLHDMSAFACATQAITELRPDTLVLLGDMLDLPDWSDHFVQSPEYAFSTQLSINWFASWLREIRPYCGRVVYIEGNHELRLVRNLMTNTISAFKLKPANLPEAPPLLSIPAMLGLDDLEIEYIGDYPKNEFWLNKNLRMIHGSKIGAKSGQTAMKMTEQLRASLMQGHVHRQESAHVTVHAQDRATTHGAYSLGTLARIDGAVPSKNGRENWQQGFAVIDHDATNFQVNMVNIWNGGYIWNGKAYQADTMSNDGLPQDYIEGLLRGFGVSGLINETAGAA